MARRTPSPAQAVMLRRALASADRPPFYGLGLLAVDLRTYDACLRREWLEQVPVERGFGLGPGAVARITDAGRAALEAGA